jgi:hypothetical protein
MKEKLFTIYEACQHPEAIAKGLRPPGLTHAVIEGRLPAQLRASKNHKERAVYYVSEQDLLDFLDAANINQVQFVNGSPVHLGSEAPRRKKPVVDEETKRKLLKLQLIQEAREYGKSLMDYLEMIDQVHLADYLAGATDNDTRTENA